MTPVPPAIAPSAVSMPAAPARLWPLDALRGAAIVAMIVFHFAWDLSALGFIATDVTEHQGWRLFSHAIAGSFLAIAGAALALAHGAGLRREAFLRRLAIIAAAAALVTAGTWFAFPDRFVTFGILHAIALFSLLALPLARAAWPLPLLLAAGVVAAHLWLQSPASAALQAWLADSALGPLWRHLGLTWDPPASVDFVPLVPWFACLLAGVAAGGRLLVSRRQASPAPAAANPLIVLGRWSLPIYLVHQPILYGGLALLAMAAPQLTIGHGARMDQRFVGDCVTQCRATASRETCEAGCNCVLNGLRADPTCIGAPSSRAGRTSPPTRASRRPSTPAGARPERRVALIG